MFYSLRAGLCKTVQQVTLGVGAQQLYMSSSYTPCRLKQVSTIVHVGIFVCQPYYYSLTFHGQSKEFRA